MVDESKPDKPEEIRVEYGETIGFPLWFTMLLSLIFIGFISYIFKTRSFEEMDPREEEVENEEVEETREEVSKQISKKQIKKMEKKMAERMEKESLKKEREEKMKAQQEKQAEIDRKYKEREEKRIQKELEIQEEENRIYNELKAKIVIEGQGYVEENTTKTDISDLVNYIKLKKTSNLEDLSALLNIKTNSCVDRIAQLESDNRIFGIINTQGLYLYISEDEIDEFCSFIGQMGRIHKQYDLVAGCNRIFRLTSREEDKDKIDMIYKKLVPQTSEATD